MHLLIRGAPGARNLLLPVVLVAGLSGCNGILPVAVQGSSPDIAGRDVRLTFLHTSDIHSRLLEYEFDPSFTDNQLGLADEMGPYGGIAEMGTLLRR